MEEVLDAKEQEHHSGDRPANGNQAVGDMAFGHLGSCQRPRTESEHKITQRDGPSETVLWVCQHVRQMHGVDEEEEHEPQQ